MEVVLSIVGFVIVSAVIFDILFTVLAPNGSGWITGWLLHYIWRGALHITNRNGRSLVLSNLGVFLLIFVVQFWVLGIWLGNTLIVYSHPEAILTSDKSEFVTDFVSSMYFAAYVLSGMGNGDFTPNGDFWKFYTSFISFTGVIFISLAISYLIPILQAVTDKRKLAVEIHALGRTPEELLLNNWNDDHFKYLIAQLHAFKSDFVKLAQQHLAYPVIHYFHSTHIYESTSVALAKVDETITILNCILDDNKLELDSRNKLKDIRSAMTYLLETLESGYIKPGDDEPKVPALDYLSENNVPISLNLQQVKSHFRSLRNRRKLTLAHVQSDAWTWEDVVSRKSKIEIKD